MPCLRIGPQVGDENVTLLVGRRAVGRAVKLPNLPVHLQRVEHVVQAANVEAAGGAANWVVETTDGEQAIPGDRVSRIEVLRIGGVARQQGGQGQQTLHRPPSVPAPPLYLTATPG